MTKELPTIPTIKMKTEKRVRIRYLVDVLYSQTPGLETVEVVESVKVELSMVYIVLLKLSLIGAQQRRMRKMTPLTNSIFLIFDFLNEKCVSALTNLLKTLLNPILGALRCTLAAGGG